MIYRPEHPKPQMRRDSWLNLNGKWHFAVDDGDKNDEFFMHAESYREIIEIPFCPESKLSGIGCKNFMHSVWYRRKIKLSPEHLSGKVVIRFGAVDYKARIFINGKLTGEHIGGYVSFEIDITPYVTIGENVITVNALDDTTSNSVPSGKQSGKEESYGCHYTRTTGIWQTVWLEFLPDKYIKCIKIDSDITKGNYFIKGEVNYKGKFALCYRVSYKGAMVSQGELAIEGAEFLISDCIHNPKLWNIGKGNLYDIQLELKDLITDKTDTLNSYFGYRKIEIAGKEMLLNGNKIFLRQVLDQGFYPDGIYTAPDDEILRRDIDIALRYGFNGARLHQKIFEERYLYYADLQGFLVWEEYPNWGCKMTSDNAAAVDNALSEWKEAVRRDINHPCIIGWCPLNEAWFIGSNATDENTQRRFYDATKMLDSTRPVIGSSGGDMFVTDIHDVHFYSHNPKTLARRIKSGDSNAIPSTLYKLRYLFCGKLMKKRELRKLPLYVSEYGGLSYKTEGKSWGYFAAIKSEKDFVAKYLSLTNVIYDEDCIGYCYTQLYDVEQEQNGLLKYDRSHKLSHTGIEAIRKCNMRKR